MPVMPPESCDPSDPRSPGGRPGGRGPEDGAGPARSLYGTVHALAAATSSAADVRQLLDALTRSPDEHLAHVLQHVPADLLTEQLRGMAQRVGARARRYAALAAFYARPDLPAELLDAAIAELTAELRAGRSGAGTELRVIAERARMTRAQVDELVAVWHDVPARFRAATQLVLAPVWRETSCAGPDSGWFSRLPYLA